jgi:hypothetical protein
MGRLTLNVLLSFAQFEREVTSERIRDKIAASKRKGLWVGGPLPLGYELKDGKLTVVEEEAERVRMIVRRYLWVGPSPIAHLCGLRMKASSDNAPIANKPPILVRPSRDTDVDAMLSIYRRHIRRGVEDSVDESGTPEPDDLRDRRKNFRNHRLPHLVATLCA